MKVLIACEYSGTVRDAFLKRGHDAYSCDTQPTLTNPSRHLQQDVTPLLNEGWDLLIAHPPCTHLAVSGARWFSKKQKEQALALDFVRTLLAAPIPKICLENPISIISTRIRKPDQIIQPYQFGHPESKRTCLWLQGLPNLTPTDEVSPPRYREDGKPQWDNQTPTGQNKLGPSPERAMIRARTYPGIAEAMARQWG